MDCNQAIDLLPGYAVSALSEIERAELEEHLHAGCPSCQHEHDTLIAAASLLAENVAPAALRAEVKHALLERIESEQLSPSSVFLENMEETFVGKRGWSRYLPYVAATLCAVALGVWGARSADQRENIDQEIDEWQRRIAAAQQVFGAPLVQLAKLEADAGGLGLAAAVFYDGLSSEMHVLVANASPPSIGHELWLWLDDQHGSRLSQGPLKYLGQGHAVGIFDLSASPAIVSELAFKVIITDEPRGDHVEPTGTVIGQTKTSEKLQ